MATSTQALTGNRVYGGHTQSPNRGAVSARGAQGYVRREMVKNRGIATPVGSDGQSDSRSTVASRALSRQQALTAAPSGGPKTLPSEAGNPGSPLPDKGAPVGSAPAPAKPVIQVTADGQLQLPYTDTMAQAGLTAYNESAAALLDLQQQQQQQNMQYATASRDLAENQKLDNRDILNSNASGGTAFSSQFVRQRNLSDRDYSRQQGDLTSQNAAFNQAAIARQAAIVEAFNRMLQSGAYDNVNELAQDAGNLGFGQGAPKVNKKTKAKNPNKKKKAKGGTSEGARKKFLGRQLKQEKGGSNG